MTSWDKLQLTPVLLSSEKWVKEVEWIKGIISSLFCTCRFEYEHAEIYYTRWLWICISTRFANGFALILTSKWVRRLHNNACMRLCLLIGVPQCMFTFNWRNAHEFCNSVECTTHFRLVIWVSSLFSHQISVRLVTLTSSSWKKRCWRNKICQGHPQWKWHSFSDP